MSAESGKRLRAFVERHYDTSPGWTLALADEVGVSKTSLMQWFSGKVEPTGENLKALAKVLRVKRFELVKALDGE